jgi:hypothetical protein
MSFPKFTQCFLYSKGDEKPFNITDLTSTILGAGGPALLAGLLSVLLGSFGLGAIFMTIGIVTAIVSAANQWLFHRLVCLNDKKCAVGIVEATPTDGGLGNFDNDQFFDLVLLPHRREDLPIKPTPVLASDFPITLASTEVIEIMAQVNFLDAHPKNYTLQDGFMGEELLKRNEVRTADLPYDFGVYGDFNASPIKPAKTDWQKAVAGQTFKDKDGNARNKQFATSLNENKWLHCEAEGDFWVKMKEWAWLVGGIIGTAIAAGVAIATGPAIGTAFAIGAAMCALGPILCAIGLLLALLAALVILAIGALAGAAVGAAIVYPLVDTLFEDGLGNVEDYNVGDTSLGPITVGDKVAVMGEHIYDGFHEGWNEFHPMIAVMKINKEESSQYLQWNPEFTDGVHAYPDDLEHWPANIRKLKQDDMRQGLNSQKMAERAKFLREQWCNMIQEAYRPDVKKDQLNGPYRWTIHPEIDGCKPQKEPDVPK